MFYLNPQYLLYMAPALLVMFLAQWYVKSTYRKWGQVPARSRINGAEAAQRLKSSGGLHDVQIQSVQGELNDHYDPRKKVLKLSRDVSQGQSVASLAIAAHELGHAMQDKEGYLPLQFRSMLVPAVNIGSTLGWILIMVGLLINLTGLAWLGVVAFSGGAVFALATLPVEINASARAKKLLNQSGLIQGQKEKEGVNKVLNAAALTYVASLFTAVMQLLYWISLVSGSGGRRRR
ncbi:MAG: zinc metallopeptidase [Anaerolineales bacterium]|nr:zinc metallopeptidase [Anaerolineales bacterium]MBS3751845.1 zinc metallopeptidase [Anaerolineales bacterium]